MKRILARTTAVAAIALSCALVAPTVAAAAPPARPATVAQPADYWFDTQAYFATLSNCNDWGAKLVSPPSWYDEWVCWPNADGTWELWLHHI